MDNIEWKHGKPELDCLNGYESPVTVHYEDMLTHIRDSADGQIMAEIKMYVDVDRDELIKAMNYDRNQYATGYRNGYADAQKRGKWIPAFDGRYLGGAYWFNCSECGKIVPGGLSSGKLYCERCGARMDGKK